MSTFYTTFAAVAEDQYRRERAAHEMRLVGGLHPAARLHHPTRLPRWRVRRATRPVGR